MLFVGLLFFLAMLIPVVMAVFYTNTRQCANSVPNSIEASRAFATPCSAFITAPKKMQPHIKPDAGKREQ